jgi:hypothetical protein
MIRLKSPGARLYITMNRVIMPAPVAGSELSGDVPVNPEPAGRTVHEVKNIPAAFAIIARENTGEHSGCRYELSFDRKKNNPDKN